MAPRRPRRLAGRGAVESGESCTPLPTTCKAGLPSAPPDSRAVVPLGWPLLTGMEGYHLPSAVLIAENLYDCRVVDGATRHRQHWNVWAYWTEDDGVDSESGPRYAGMRRDGVELHFQWHAAEDVNRGDRPTSRFLVPDVDLLSTEFSAGGVALDRTEVCDTPWGTRELHLRDPDGNGLQLHRLRR